MSEHLPSFSGCHLFGIPRCSRDEQLQLLQILKSLQQSPFSFFLLVILGILNLHTHTHTHTHPTTPTTTTPPHTTTTTTTPPPSSTQNRAWHTAHTYLWSVHFLELCGNNIQSPCTGCFEERDFRQWLLSSPLQFSECRWITGIWQLSYNMRVI